MNARNAKYSVGATSHTYSRNGKLIRDNGIVSSLNRGTFYGCRDLNGNLEGVALVGHAT